MLYTITNSTNEKATHGSRPSATGMQVPSLYGRIHRVSLTMGSLFIRFGNKTHNRIIQCAKQLGGFFVISVFFISLPVLAKSITTTVGGFAAALQRGQNGAQILLQKGRYTGNFIINKSITLACASGAILDGGGHGNTLTITAKNVTVTGCRIINWGHDLTTMDAGIYVRSSASHVLIKNNYLRGDAFGVYLDSCADATVEGNKVEGNLKIRSQDRGNGIHLSGNHGADIANNEIWHTRDGIYIQTSNGNTLRHNEMHDLRYGIHYMYSYNNIIKNNYTHNTRTGYAMMQSKYLTIIGNRSDHDQNYGMLMNFITHSTISGNTFSNVNQGVNPSGQQTIDGAEGKALFVYNSLFNTISNNKLEKSDIGIHLTAGSEDNTFFGNQFVHNRRQVKYVGRRRQEWSHNGRGNYWSDYMGWDRDNNGIGDTWYEPNDSIDKLLWKYPSAKLLMNSPAIRLLKAVQSEFPVLKSPGIRDSHPLMSPPTDTTSIMRTHQ